jgi:hypothetical protein
VISPVPGPPFTGPAYEYTLATDRVPPLGAQGDSGDATLARVKLFIPGSRWTLFVYEHDPAEQIVFGWIVSPLAAELDEWGHASLHEIAALRVPLGLPPERDLAFAPALLAQARDEYRRRSGEAPR